MAGVALVVNESPRTPKYYKAAELVPARAIALKEKWHESEEATIINVYAPDNRSERPDLWERVELERGNRGFNSPDFPLGDFNVTEDPIDRALIHQEDESAVEALRDLRRQLDLEDIWRHMNCASLTTPTPTPTPTANKCSPGSI